MSTPKPLLPQTGNSRREKDNEFTNRRIHRNFTEYENVVHTANVSIKLAFLKKVYSIITLYLLTITGGTTIFMVIGEPVKTFVKNDIWVLLTSCVLTFVILVALYAKRKLFPINFILLVAFTLLQTLMFGFWRGFWLTNLNFWGEIYAFSLTTFVVFSLTLYTLQSKRDFSFIEAGLYAAFVVLVVGEILIITSLVEWRETLIFGSLSIIISLCIISSTHKLIHKHKSEDFLLVSIKVCWNIFTVHLIILLIAEVTDLIKKTNIM